MPSIPGLFAYVGPETFLPAASILAAIGGFVLMFWRAVIRLFRGRLASVRRHMVRRRVPPRPHFAMGGERPVALRAGVASDAPGDADAVEIRNEIEPTQD